VTLCHGRVIRVVIVPAVYSAKQKALHAHAKGVLNLWGEQRRGCSPLLASSRSCSGLPKGLLPPIQRSNSDSSSGYEDFSRSPSTQPRDYNEQQHASSSYSPAPEPVRRTLDTELGEDNKGLKMLKAMGWVRGSGLGVNGRGQFLCRICSKQGVF
jgi:hypothetical protein